MITVMESQSSLPASARSTWDPYDQSKPVSIGEACTPEKKHMPGDTSFHAFCQTPQGHVATEYLLLSEGLASYLWLEKLLSANTVRASGAHESSVQVV